MYHSIIRPVLFLIDPEKVHKQLFGMMNIYKHLSPLRIWIRKYCNTSTPYSFRNMKFKNRIGLSAGFDKNGVAFDELADFGFGFLELGTVTPDNQSGNPVPRIFRLVKDDSLISRTGFNNEGLYPLLERLKKIKNRDYVLGVNINKDAASCGEQVIADFNLLFEELYPYVDYFTLNWGSIETETFTHVLESLGEIRKKQSSSKSILIKLPADISPEILDNIITIAYTHGVDGFIATGPTLDRSALKNTTPKQLHSIGAGGVSGKGIGDKALKIVLHLAKATKGDFLIIGAGGIMTPSNAREMLKAGADLVQIYSAFIYEGPFIVRKIGKAIGQ